MIKLSKAAIKQAALFTFIIFSAVVILQSCKKTDELNVNSTVTHPNIANKFFTIPANTDELVKRVAVEIEKRNNKKEFVQEFANKYGYPVWNKVLEQGVVRKNNTQGLLQTNSTDTIVFIPIVLEDEEKVNGYIKAVFSDSLYLSYSLAQDYKNYSFITDNEGQSAASKFAFLNMELNRLVFDVVDYEITDHRLFSPDTITTKARTLRINPVISSANPSLLTTLCSTSTITYAYCGSSYCHAHGGGSCLDMGNCPLGECYYYSQTTTTCVTFETGSGIPGGGIPSGGGGGGEIPHDYPCIPVLYPSINADPLPPCPPPGPGTGTEPTAIDVISSPNAPEYPDISENEPQVSLQSLFNCFAQIPDAGATYSVKLNVDLPVNSIWNAPFNLTHKSPGHTFLTLTKTNGTQSISQSVGFYPIGSGGNPMNPTAPGGFKNNGYPDHEYNAAITAYNVSASQFTMVMNNLLSHENDTYNIFNNNCATIGLNAFNLLITPKITVEPFIVQLPTNPPQAPYFFMQSPQKLYKAIETFQPGFGLSKQFEVNYDSPLSTKVCP